MRTYCYALALLLVGCAEATAPEVRETVKPHPAADVRPWIPENGVQA